VCKTLHLDERGIKEQNVGALDLDVPLRIQQSPSSCVVVKNHHSLEKSMKILLAACGGHWIGA
jgi:hypothetical protein